MKKITVFCFGFFLALFLIPLFFTLEYTNPAAFREVFTLPYYFRLIARTLLQAFLSSLLSLFFGFPGAWILTNVQFKGKKIIESIFNIPFALPSVLAVLGFVIFYGKNGFCNKLFIILGLKPVEFLYSFKAVLAAHIFFNAPVVASAVSRKWKTLNPNCEKAAATLGKNPLQIFFSVTLPGLKDAIISSLSMVFLYCFASFSVVLILGGGPKNSMVSVEIYNLAKRTQTLPQAVALSLVSSLCALAVLCFRTFKTSFTENTAPVKRKHTKKQNLFVKILIGLYLTVAVIFILGPVLSIGVRSVACLDFRGGPVRLDFSAYKNIPADVILNSLAISALSSLITLTLGLVFCNFLKNRKGRFLQLVLMLPMAVNSVIIGLSYMLITSAINLNPSLMSIFALSIINVPFTIRTLQPVCNGIGNNILNASRTLGKSDTATFFSVTLPLMKPAALSCFIQCMALSMGELNSSLIIGGGNFRTIAVLLYKQISSYNYQAACALGFVLCIFCFAASMFKEHLNDKIRT